MDFQVIYVVREGLNIHHLHPLAYPAYQTGTLVAGKIEAAVVLEIEQQGLGLLLLSVSHATSPVVTRVTRADGISSSGRMKSTLPVCTAAPGMPKNSAVFSSWTMTVPPIFLIALTPMEPSLPVPERTTAIERSL